MTRGRKPPAELDQVEELLVRARSLSGERREELFRQAMEGLLPLAVSMAHRYRFRGEADEDLEQVASLAAVLAVRRYVPGQGTSLAGFAVPTIQGELKRHFRDRAWTVRPPRALQELRIAAHAVEARLTQALGHEPSDAELAAELDVDEGQVRQMRVASDGYFGVPLDVEDVERRTAVDEQPELLAAVDLDAALPALDALPDRDRRVLAMHFYGGLSQQQIADRLGVSQVQVSRILAASTAAVRTAVAG